MVKTGTTRRRRRTIDALLSLSGPNKQSAASPLSTPTQGDAFLIHSLQQQRLRKAQQNGSVRGFKDSSSPSSANLPAIPQVGLDSSSILSGVGPLVANRGSGSAGRRRRRRSSGLSPRLSYSSSAERVSTPPLNAVSSQPDSSTRKGGASSTPPSRKSSSSSSSKRTLIHCPHKG